MDVWSPGSPQGGRWVDCWGRGKDLESGVQEVRGLMKWLTSPLGLVPPGKKCQTVFRCKNGREDEAQSPPVGPGPAQGMLGDLGLTLESPHSEGEMDLDKA